MRLIGYFCFEKDNEREFFFFNNINYFIAVVLFGRNKGWSRSVCWTCCGVERKLPAIDMVECGSVKGDLFLLGNLSL